MNDEKIWLETEDGQKLFIIKSEKIDMQEELNKTIEKLQQELQRKDNIINELKEKINQFTLIIGYYDYNDEGNDEIGENNNLQEELLNIINLDKIKEIEK